MSYVEFMEGVCGPWPTERKQVVNDAWRALARGRPAVPTAELLSRFDCAWYPAVRAFVQGARVGLCADPAAVAKAVEERFTGVTELTKGAFRDWHHEWSACIEADRAFEAVVRNTWRLPYPRP